jgi:hypothetical protein
MTAELDYGDGGLSTNLNNTFEFSFYVDYESPIIKDVEFYSKYDKSLKDYRYYCDVYVYDNHYAQSIRPFTISNGKLVSLSDNVIPIYGERGEISKVNIEITDYMDLLQYGEIEDGKYPMTNGLGFLVDDYALNQSYSFVTLPGTNSNEISDALAEKAVELFADYIVPAYKNGNDLVAREKMHTASCLAGIAFNEAGLGINHSIAHALGANFHIPHGRANAMLLPHVLRYNTELDIKFCVKNANPTADKLESLARRLGYPANSSDIGVRNMIVKIKEYQRWLNIPTTLGEAGVSKKDYLESKQHIIESALADACTATNPRKPDAAGIAEILDKIDIFI